MRIIHQAAIMHNGMVYKGKRHRDIAINNRLGSGRTEGFITIHGTFVDRREAARLAYAHGQIREQKDKLRSEDIY